MLWLGVAPLQAQPLRVITEEWPPYNFQAQGSAQGLGVEVVKALLESAGVAHTPIEFLPWNRAYAIALKEPQVLIFTMGRNAQRESLFHWVARIAPRELWLYRLASRNDIQITQLDQAKRYVLGVASMEDASTQELVARGFEPGRQLDSVQGADPDGMNIQKLLAGRFDLMVGNPISVHYTAQQRGVAPGTIVPAFKWNMDSPGYWVAASLNTDPKTLAALSLAAKRLEQRGSLQTLRARYLGAP